MLPKFFASILAFYCVPAAAAFLVVPEDVGTAFAAIYGFSPRVVLGRDHRFGFGFRLGNHADFQLLYELGPQTRTASLETSTRVRSVTSSQRARRRPFVELLLRAGVLLNTGSPAARPPPDTRAPVDRYPRADRPSATRQPSNARQPPDARAPAARQPPPPREPR